MEEKEVILTQEGFDKIEKELEYLRTEKRAEIAERIKVALGFGDLSENSEYDEAKTVLEEKEIGVQVNGKLRGSINVHVNDSDDVIKEKALSNENVIRHIDGKEIVKIIVIKGRIVNIVVK